ncbi:MAG: amidohydrolase family protein [Bryobacterales bacterium]|nr:amidohydrolase family protein [Bryobacterales bacterium]
MKRVLRWSLLGLISCLLAAQQQPKPVMTIEEYEPKSLLVVPERKVTRAKYPFVDIHNHQNSAGGDRLDQLVREMDEINMAVMVNLSGRYGDALKENVARQKTKYKDRFVIFANIDFTDVDAPDYPQRAAARLEQDIKNGAQGLKIFKNFGMDIKDKAGNRIKTDDPRYDQVFQMCAKYKIPVLIHTGEPKGLFLPFDKSNERWLELAMRPRHLRLIEMFPSFDELMAEQHRLFARHPKTNFIAAHLGWYGFDLARLGALMDKMPNMYTEIGAVVEELGRQPRAAKQFFIKYQDRIFFGKDTYRKAEYGTYFRTLETADEYFDHDRKYHGIWKMYGLDLPDDVLRKVYYKNALKLVPGMNASLFPR